MAGSAGMVMSYFLGMDEETELSNEDRDALIGIIVRQQSIIEGLEKRVAQLEGKAKHSGARRISGLKGKAEEKPTGRV